MQYNFPHIGHLDQVRDVIRDRDEFIIGERDWGFVSNYLVAFEDTFPVVDSVEAAIRRELRGIKFDRNGKIAARPYQKFFNLGERAETQDHAVDFDQPFTILDKLDGSMVHPFIYGDQLLWMTKMGPTDTARRAGVWAAEHPEFEDISRDLLQNGYTPIYEWVSPEDRIVVKYAEPSLYLTAIRDTVTGEYLDYDEIAQFAELRPVRQFTGTFEGIQEFAATVRERKDEEGYIIRFDDGHMLKIKNLWYLQIHKVKEMVEQEKNVWKMILDESIDDVKPFMMPDDRERIEAYHKAFEEGVLGLAARLQEVADAMRADSENQREFAANVTNKSDRRTHGLLFQIGAGKPALDVVRQYLAKYTGSQNKVDQVKDLIGIGSWTWRNSE